MNYEEHYDALTRSLGRKVTPWSRLTDQQRRDYERMVREVMTFMQAVREPSAEGADA